MDPSNTLTVIVNGDFEPGSTLILSCEAALSCSTGGETTINDGTVSRSYDFINETPGRMTVTVQGPDGDVSFARTTGLSWNERNPRSACPSGSIAQLTLDA